jgi:hypothetical protein
MTLHNGHIALVGIQVVYLHRTKDKYLICYVNYIVLHHIKKGEREGER